MATFSYVVLTSACALAALACLVALATCLLPSGWRPRRTHRGD